MDNAASAATLLESSRKLKLLHNVALEVWSILLGYCVLLVNYNSATTQVTGEIDLDRVFRLVSMHARELSSAERASLFLLDGSITNAKLWTRVPAGTVIGRHIPTSHH